MCQEERSQGAKGSDSEDRPGTNNSDDNDDCNDHNNNVTRRETEHDYKATTPRHQGAEPVRARGQPFRPFELEQEQPAACHGRDNAPWCPPPTPAGLVAQGGLARPRPGLVPDAEAQQRPVSVFGRVGRVEPGILVRVRLFQVGPAPYQEAGGPLASHRDVGPPDVDIGLVHLVKQTEKDGEQRNRWVGLTWFAEKRFVAILRNILMRDLKLGMIFDLKKIFVAIVRNICRGREKWEHSQFLDRG